MQHSKFTFKNAAIKNIWVILGVTCLALAWFIEKNAIQARQKEIESKRLLWEQYRTNNTTYAIINSKFETMRLIDLATSSLPKDSISKAQILLQLRFALFNHLTLRITIEEALYLLEKDPLDDETAYKLNIKRKEATDALNTRDINKLLSLHERDNDYDFNNAEIRTKQYVQDFNKLLKRHEKAEYFYLILYVLGSVLVVYQKIHDTLYLEKESLTNYNSNSKSKNKRS